MSFVEDAFETVGDWVDEGVDQLGEWGEDIVGGVESVVEEVGDVGGSLVEGVENFGEETWDEVESAADTVGEEVESGWDSLESTVEDYGQYTPWTMHLSEDFQEDFQEHGPGAIAGAGTGFIVGGPIGAVIGGISGAARGQFGGYEGSDSILPGAMAGLQTGGFGGGSGMSIPGLSSIGNFAGDVAGSVGNFAGDVAGSIPGLDTVGNLFSGGSSSSGFMPGEISGIGFTPGPGGAPVSGEIANTGIMSGNLLPSMGGTPGGLSGIMDAASSGSSLLDNVSDIGNILGGDGQPGQTGGNDWLQNLLTTGGDIWSISEQQEFMEEQQEEVLDTVDPFREYRGQYAEDLNQLMQNPESIEDTPGYEYRMEQAAETMNRQMGASGQALSGRRQLGLQETGAKIAGQEFQNQFSRLATLSGGGSPNLASSSGNMMNQFVNRRAGLQSQMFSSIGRGLADIFGGNSSDEDPFQSMYSGSSNSQFSMPVTNTNTTLSQFQNLMP